MITFSKPSKRITIRASAHRTTSSRTSRTTTGEISSGFPALSAHVLVGADCNCHAARRAMESMLHERFELDHTTLQVDHTGSELLEIEPVRDSRGGY